MKTIKQEVLTGDGLKEVYRVFRSEFMNVTGYHFEFRKGERARIKDIVTYIIDQTDSPSAECVLSYFEGYLKNILPKWKNWEGGTRRNCLGFISKPDEVTIFLSGFDAYSEGLEPVVPGSLPGNRYCEIETKENYAYSMTPWILEEMGPIKALAISQINFFCHYNYDERRMSAFIEGEWWMARTFDEWSKIISWTSKRTIQRQFKELEEEGIIIITKLVSGPLRDVNHYRLNYAKLEELYQGREAA